MRKKSAYNPYRDITFRHTGFLLVVRSQHSHPPQPVGLDDIAGRDPLIVFDGECVLCSAQAQFVLRHDRARRFRLTTAQGELGQALYRRLGLPSEVYETMLLIEDGRALTHSDAALGVARGLGWPWRLAAMLRIVPRGWRDRLYRIVADNRYRWFGRRQVCWRPTADVADRVL